MTTDQLHQALVHDGHDMPPALLARVIDTLTGARGADGLPDLGFLAAPLQVSVLAALYRDWIEAIATARQPRQ